MATIFSVVDKKFIAYQRAQTPWVVLGRGEVVVDTYIKMIFRLHHSETNPEGAKNHLTRKRSVTVCPTRKNQIRSVHPSHPLARTETLHHRQRRDHPMAGLQPLPLLSVPNHLPWLTQMRQTMLSVLHHGRATQITNRQFLSSLSLLQSNHNLHHQSLPQIVTTQVNSLGGDHLQSQRNVSPSLVARLVSARDTYNPLVRDQYQQRGISVHHCHSHLSRPSSAVFVRKEEVLAQGSEQARPPLHYQMVIRCQISTTLSNPMIEVKRQLWVSSRDLSVNSTSSSSLNANYRW